MQTSAFAQDISNLARRRKLETARQRGAASRLSSRVSAAAAALQSASRGGGGRSGGGSGGGGVLGFARRLLRGLSQNLYLRLAYHQCVVVPVRHVKARFIVRPYRAVEARLMRSALYSGAQAWVRRAVKLIQGAA